MGCFHSKVPRLSEEVDEIPNSTGSTDKKASYFQILRSSSQALVEQPEDEPPSKVPTRWWPPAVNDPPDVVDTKPTAPPRPKHKPVKVAVVVRPLLSGERKRGAVPSVFIQRPGRVQIPAMSFGGSTALMAESEYSFNFDRAYMMTGKEAALQLFEEMLQPSIHNCFVKGINTMVFAYGQAGAGKTSVLGMGRVFAGGLFQLAIAAVWEGLAELGPEYTVTMEVTFVELHNNQIRDLLNDKGGPGRLRQCPVNGPYLENVTELRVNEPEGVLHAVAQGNARRISAGRTTKGHRRTSRAHAILTLNMMQRRDAEPGVVPHMINSKLQFVDLAGSDGVRGRSSLGRAAGEVAAISKELLALGNVISAATAQLDKHVPYRDSLLTRMLQDCPGRASETVLLACLNAADTSHEHSLQTLRFAERAHARNLPVHGMQACSEEAYLRRLVVEEKQACIAASEALALEYPPQGNGLPDMSWSTGLIYPNFTDTPASPPPRQVSSAAAEWERRVAEQIAEDEDDYPPSVEALRSASLPVKGPASWQTATVTPSESTGSPSKTPAARWELPKARPLKSSEEAAGHFAQKETGGNTTLSEELRNVQSLGIVRRSPPRQMSAAGTMRTEEGVAQRPIWAREGRNAPSSEKRSRERAKENPEDYDTDSALSEGADTPPQHRELRAEWIVSRTLRLPEALKSPADSPSKKITNGTGAASVYGQEVSEEINSPAQTRKVLKRGRASDDTSSRR